MCQYLKNKFKISSFLSILFSIVLIISYFSAVCDVIILENCQPHTEIE